MSFRDNPASSWWTVAIAAAIAGGIILWRNRDNLTGPSGGQTAQVQSPEQTSTSAEQTANSGAPPSSLPITQPDGNQEVDPSEGKPPPPPYMVESEKVLNGFKEVARLEAELPTDLIYQEILLDDQVKSIHGSSPDGKNDLTALAYGKDANPDEAMEFLKQIASDLPAAKNSPVKGVDKGVDFPAPSPNSGFQGAKVWTAEHEDGRLSKVAFIRRSDGKGSYMFIITGSKQELEENDGLFDEIYANSRALPAP